MKPIQSTAKLQEVYTSGQNVPGVFKQQMFEPCLPLEVVFNMDRLASVPSDFVAMSCSTANLKISKSEEFHLGGSVSTSPRMV